MRNGQHVGLTSEIIALVENVVEILVMEEQCKRKGDGVLIKERQCRRIASPDPYFSGDGCQCCAFDGVG